MQTKKETNIFEKFVKRNYKNELEEVLENKIFGETTKSLLLEILYKIEVAYRDYEIVKKDTKTKEEYIDEYIKIIKQKCKTIKIVQPNSEQSKRLEGKTFKINQEKGEIICLPIARKLLYAIYKIDKQNKIVNDKYFLLSTTISNLINVGNNINQVEPLRDFNGWSWTTVSREIESIEHNLVYQLLLMLAGENFLQQWIKTKNSILDYMEELENKLEADYGQELSQKIMQVIKKISVLLEVKVNPAIKEEIDISRIKTEEKLEKFENKEEYIKQLTIQKNDLKEKIKKIDTTINDKNLLQEEYVKRNNKLQPEEKIFSMRILAELMIKEREELFENLEELNSLLMPKEFMLKREGLEKELQILNLANIENLEMDLRRNLQILQELFLECFKEKIKKANEKEEVIKLVYKFRYYCLLPYNQSENVFVAPNLQNKLNEIGKLLIKKAINLKAIIQFSEFENLNYEIIKNIFNVRIVVLEELYMKIIREKDEYFIQFFDENAFDKKIKLNIGNINKKEMKVRLNKKVKLFE